MRYSKTDYPIGATWRFVNKEGGVSEVWLKERNEYFEVWCNSFNYSDGSGYESDWFTSKKQAIYWCPIHSNEEKIRFKRVQ